jgi:hypothetical protein
VRAVAADSVHMPRGDPRAWPQYLEHRRLGTTARYEFIGAEQGLVDVEVIEAPGLLPGTRIRLTESAARRMAAAPDPAVDRAAEPEAPWGRGALAETNSSAA